MPRKLLTSFALVAATFGLWRVPSPARASLNGALHFAALSGYEGFMCKGGLARQESCLETDDVCDQLGRCRDLFDMTLQSVWASEAAYQDRRWNVSYRREALARVGLRERAYIAVGEWLFDDAEVVIAEGPSLIVVAVSGTETNVADILSDVDFSFTEPSAAWTPVPASSPRWAGVRVHDGFLEFADTVWPSVKRELNGALAEKPRPVRFVGHSLGGAVAQLLALRANGEITPVDAVVTFGSPKVGNSVYESAYEGSLHFATHRWVNDDDVVPNLAPFSEWRRAGQQHYMAYTGDDGAGINVGTISYSTPFQDPYAPPTLDRDSTDHERAVRERHWSDHSLMSAYLPMIEGFAPCDHPWRTTRWGCPR